MPTPNLYVDIESDPFARVPPHFRSNTIDVFYATDRKPVEGRDGSLQYGYGRSQSLAFGSCLVEIGKNVPWELLVAESRSHKRSGPLPLAIREIREQGQFPETPIPLAEGADGLTDSPEASAREEEMAEKLRQELRRRLAQTRKKEAYVFIHGFKSTFEEAAFVAAELWHFLGREGVPVFYTWPAGSPGLLRGYNYDRESGEFTIYHLKQFIRVLASCPELERVHVIAHSRGTDVSASALRELFIEARGAGMDPQTTFKIGNVVLAAPDLDLDVALQRFGAERFFFGVERLTMYVSEADKAIGIAGWLYSSGRRIGQLRAGDLEATQKRNLELLRRTHFVDAQVPTDGIGHSYFRAHPAVSSDLVLLLRDNRRPGKENGRPLAGGDANYWVVKEGYPGTAKGR